MEKIIVTKSEWKKTKNDQDYIIISDGRRTLSYFIPKELTKNNFNNCFNPGFAFMANVVQKGSFFNLTNVTIPSFPQPQNMHPVKGSEETRVEVPQELKEELQTSSGDILEQINTIVDSVITNPNPPRDTLLNYQLSLSALNVKLAEKLAGNNAEVKTSEFNFKKSVDVKVAEIMTNDPTIKKSPAKEQAEIALQEDKAKIIVSQNKFYSADIIHGSITSLIFSIKEKIR